MIPYYLTKLWQKLVIPNSPSCVFAFWNGMTYETQIHIIELCVFCPTVKTFAVQDSPPERRGSQDSPPERRGGASTGGGGG